MNRKLCLVVLVLGFTGYATAAIVELSDSSLLALGDVGGTAASTLDAITDIAGDPGVQYDITWAVPTSGTWADIAIGKYSPTEVVVGDTWEMTVLNVDDYYINVKLYMQVNSGWNYYQGAGLNIASGEMGTVSLFIDPALATEGTVKAIGIKIGTDSSWMGRVDGSSASVQVVPEPVTLVLLGLGGLVIRRKRS